LRGDLLVFYKEEVMNHDVREILVLVVAGICGLLLFATSKDKWGTIGGYVFLSAFVILLWLAAGGTIR
jgi:hypothetical protein